MFSDIRPPFTPEYIERPGSSETVSQPNNDPVSKKTESGLQRESFRLVITVYHL